MATDKPYGPIFRKWITTRNGVRLNAEDYGLKAWPIRRRPRKGR